MDAPESPETRMVRRMADKELRLALAATLTATDPTDRSAVADRVVHVAWLYARWAECARADAEAHNFSLLSP